MSANATQRSLRVFCPVHRIGFGAVAAETIKCEAGGHALAEKFPHGEPWEYCCDCQHFWPSDVGRSGKGREQCPVCDRAFSRRYACDRCRLVVSEADEGGRRKSHSVTPDGRVEPACPGCLSAPAGRVRAHKCDEAGVTFTTARAECPFCGDSIGDPPSFPSSVADYFAKDKSGKTEVALDARRGLLVASPGGEFVLVQTNGVSRPLALPRARRFEAKQDFYPYESFYRCEEAAAGEVWVMHPAVVDRTEEGWQLREMGWLEVRGGGRDAAAAPNGVSAADPTELRTRPLGDAAQAAHARVACPRCGAEARAEDSFCRDCGNSLALSHRPHAAPQPAPPPHLGVSFDAATARPVEPFEAAPPTQPIDPFPEAVLISPGEATPAPSPAGGRRALAFVGLFAVLAVICLIVILSVNTGPKTGAKLEQAIAQGRLVGPAGESAQDLYRQLKREGASAAELRRHEERLWPLLTAAPLRMLEDFASPRDNDPGAAEWEESHRLLSWASELRPADSAVAARAAYCQGRLAYIAERKDEALALWKKASDLDKSWALATNGVGLIYNELRDYEAARPFLREAVRRAPDWPLPYNNLGTSYYYQRRYNEARPHYERAAELAPNWARPHAWLGDIAKYNGDYERAVTEYESVLAPTAVGASRMDLDAIRRKLEEVRRLAERQRAAEEPDEEFAGEEDDPTDMR